MHYFTVGPTQMHERFREFLDAALAKDIPSISHRSSWFVGMYHELESNIRTLFSAPETHEVVFLGSATECMERAIQNLSTKRTLHFLSGSFGERCSTFASAAGRDARIVRSREDGSFSLDDIPEDAAPEAIFFTHNETSIGNVVPTSFIHAVCDRFPDAHIVCDIVSSAPTCDVPFERLDCTFFSIQKGFGLPAGLGVALLSQRAVSFSKTLFAEGVYNGLFHSFPSLVKQGKEGKTLETPNVLAMHLLNEVTKDFLARGVSLLREETHAKAARIYDALASHTQIQPSITNQAWRSPTVIVANTPSGSAPILSHCKEGGYTLASGYNKDKDIKIRIANFPQHTMQDVEHVLQLLKEISA